MQGAVPVNLSRRTFLLLAATAACPEAVQAAVDNSSATKILLVKLIPQPSSPIQLLFCYGAIGQAAGDGTIRETLFGGIRLQNNASKAVKAVRFRFDFLTDFGEFDQKASGQTYTAEGDYKPGKKYDLMDGGRGIFGIGHFAKATFHIEYGGRGDDDQMLCSIDKVAFQDGTVWAGNYAADLKTAKGSYTAFPQPTIKGGRVVMPEDGR
jgi:hypothetical protein